MAVEQGNTLLEYVYCVYVLLYTIQYTKTQTQLTASGLANSVRNHRYKHRHSYRHGWIYRQLDKHINVPVARAELLSASVAIKLT